MKALWISYLKDPSFVIDFSCKYIPTLTTIVGLTKKLFTEIYAGFSNCKYQQMPTEILVHEYAMLLWKWSETDK